MKAEGLWTVGGEELKLTNLDKTLFPPRDGVDEPALTKRDLIGYFARIAPAMLPHLLDRPLNLQRFPNGAGAPGFWQKDIPASAPKWLAIWHETGFREREDRAANDHLVADRAATLCWLGNQASFEIHAWTSTIEDPWTPTFALIDIDPGTNTTWEETLVIARLYRTALEHLGVRAYPKLTGSRGIQAWIPIERGVHVRGHLGVGREAVAGGRRDGARARVVGMGEGRSRRQGPPRLHAERARSRRSSRRTPSGRARARRSPRRSAGRSSTTRRSAPIAGRSATLPARVAEVGDLWAGLQDDHQVLPAL